jgi:hypothetical protein
MLAMHADLLKAGTTTDRYGSPQHTDATYLRGRVTEVRRRPGTSSTQHTVKPGETETDPPERETGHARRQLIYHQIALRLIEASAEPRRLGVRTTRPAGTAATLSRTPPESRRLRGAIDDHVGLGGLAAIDIIQRRIEIRDAPQPWPCGIDVQIDE